MYSQHIAIATLSRWSSVQNLCETKFSSPQTFACKTGLYEPSTLQSNSWKHLNFPCYSKNSFVCMDANNMQVFPARSSTVILPTAFRSFEFKFLVFLQNHDRMCELNFQKYFGGPNNWQEILRYKNLN